MLGTTIGAPIHMMVELELTELGPNGFTIERKVLPVGGILEYHDQIGTLMATIKVTSVFTTDESSSNSKQSVSNEERLPNSPEVSGEEATDIQV